MKPAAFRYERPDTVEETIGLLADLGDEAKVLAGGQSLVPMMNFRLARPEAIIDIARVSGIDQIRVSDDLVSIGARVRHQTLLGRPLSGPLQDLFLQAGRHIGHLPIRLRGTFGGSIAHADPVAEWCLVALALDAEVVVRSVRGERTIGLADLFEMSFTTTIAYDELLTEVRLPLLDDEWSTGFAEFSRRAGDFAIVAIATAVRVQNGLVTEAKVAAGGVAGTPIRLRAAEASLLGGPLDATSIDAASEIAAAEVDPRADIHGSAIYRRELVAALTRRALR
jgi:carbon-monoxide dehydrogenase medium subunit